ncbi:hypothetical protein E2C01_025419 [Portunus trituberculatus]|uniref:Uncharacterized protein n=1 Tax=Portunus trituberculatus TaxID=210409 RepID=A0A5B7EFH0_PORTR|nr:hypothetical protein [Portunus trituberculatus]
MKKTVIIATASHPASFTSGGVQSRMCSPIITDLAVLDLRTQQWAPSLKPRPHAVGQRGCSSHVTALLADVARSASQPPTLLSFLC